jgi:uncharacterized membrane protein
MPYEWTTPQHLRLWPHRALKPQGFVVFVGATALLMALPLLSLIGLGAMWVMLGFLGLALAGMWFALRLSWQRGVIVEDLSLEADQVKLTRRGPGDFYKEWQANRYWVRPVLHPRQGPVPQYLTLQGGPREVELGRFLSESERVALCAELQAALRR